MWFIFTLITTLCWGLAELFYKKGARQDEKFAHLKICVCVGAVMGIHAIFTLLTQDINYNPYNLIRYLPVSMLYIVSMAFSFSECVLLKNPYPIPSKIHQGQYALCCVLPFWEIDFQYRQYLL